MILAYCVAGHTFHLELPDGSTVPALLSQYKAFATAPVEHPLFTLKTVDCVPVQEKEPLFLSDPSAGAMPRLDLYSCAGGYIVEMAPLSKQPPCARLSLSGDFRDGSLAFNDSGRNTLFAVNNSLMMMYAFCSAPCMTLEMHASVVGNSGRGYLFLGKSGTGKSTHSSLWLKYIEGSELINDDNPILRVGEDGVVRVYGSPWSGKTPCYRNVSAPVGAIVRIRQAGHNTLTRLGVLESYASVYSSCSGFKADREMADGQHRTLEYLVANVPCYTLDCLPDEDAARVCSAGVMKEGPDE